MTYLGAVPDAEEDTTPTRWEQFRSERRWLVAAILIAAMIVIGAIAIIANRTIEAATAPDVDEESETSVRVSAPEPGTAVLTSAEGMPRTTLQVTGRAGSVTPQTVVVLDEEVLFDFDAAQLRPESASILDQLSDLVLASDDSAIDVVGFTDALGTEGYNLELSQRRAEAVVEYLTAQGVAAERLQADWRGEAEPAEPNSGFLGGDNPEGRAQNRRVEVVLDDDGRPVAPPPASRLGTDEHPNGVVFAVDALRVQERGIVVDARLANRAPFPVELGDDPMWLVDDVGYAYRFQPSWQNPRVAVASGVTVSGQWAFVGVVPPEATVFTLVSNLSDPADQVDADRRRDDDRTPTVIIERIPRG